MKALLLEDYGHLVVTELDEPTPRVDEVIVSVIATGICGSDVHGYTGENGRRVRGQVMGHETVGRVERVGDDVRRTDLAPGTIVTVNPVLLPPEDLAEYAGREQHDPMKRVLGVAPELVSAFAEKVAVPARNVRALPTDMPVLHGALIEPLAVAVNAVRRSGAGPEDAVLVLGGGPIGQSVVLALQMIGVREIAVTEVSPGRRQLLDGLGVITIDPAEAAVSSAVEESFGRLAGVAIDAVGLSTTLEAALTSTRLGASVCLVGMGERTLSFDAFTLSTAERSIIGSFTYADRDFDAAAEWIGQAPAVVRRLISGCVTLDAADDAFRRLAEGDAVPGKVLVVLDEQYLPARRMTWGPR